MTSNQYSPNEIERRWQDRWEADGTYRTPNPGDADFDPSRPKYYVLDMFPYPSGAGAARGAPHGLHRQRHRRPAQAHGGA